MGARPRVRWGTRVRVPARRTSPGGAGRASAGGVRLTYVGHATLLVELAGVTLLTDPNFDDALGVALGSRLRRVAPPGIALDALPRLDGVLVTHAHVDHLSLASLDAITGAVPGVPVVAPPAVARWLDRRGVPHVQALAAGAALDLADLGGSGARVTVHAAPAVHVGSRWGVDRWRAESLMYLVEAPSASLFFAGDTALTPDTPALVQAVLHAAGRPLDVACLPIGHAPWWKRRSFRRGHLTHDDALALLERLDARWMVPYHWGTFNHLTSGAHDAIVRLRAAIPHHPHGARVRILEPGATLAVPTAGDPVPAERSA